MQFVYHGSGLSWIRLGELEERIRVRAMEELPREKLTRQFRMIAKIEAASFILLLIATFYKYSQHEPLAVLIIGPIHGFLYMFYAAGAFNLGGRCKWSLKKTLLVLAAGSIPFGGFVIEHRLDELVAV